MKPKPIHTQIEPHFDPTRNEALALHIEFGTPSKECANFGICRVQMLNKGFELKPPDTCDCKGIGYIDKIENGLLKIIFPKIYLSQKAAGKHFGNGHFQIDEQFVLPQFLKEKLKLETAFISSGNYPIIENEEFYEVYLEVR